MKGKLDIRFAMPNTARFRSRVEKPSKELTSQLRTKLQEVTVNVLNKNILDIRAQMIAYVDSLGLKYKSDAHKAQVMSVVNNLFDTVFAKSQAELDAIVGDDADDKGEDAGDKGDEGDKGDGDGEGDGAGAPADKKPAKKAGKPEKKADDFD